MNGLEPCNLGVLDHFSFSLIANSFNNFVNYVEWYKEPFSRFDWISKAIFNGQVDLSFAEQALEWVYHHKTVQVMKILCS
jgi:hypothetical protein